MLRVVVVSSVVVVVIVVVVVVVLVVVVETVVAVVSSRGEMYPLTLLNVIGVAVVVVVVVVVSVVVKSNNLWSFFRKSPSNCSATSSIAPTTFGPSRSSWPTSKAEPARVSRTNKKLLISTTSRVRTPNRDAKEEMSVVVGA